MPPDGGLDSRLVLHVGLQSETRRAFGEKHEFHSPRGFVFLSGGHKKKYECEFFLAGSELKVSGGEEPRTLRVGSRGLGDKAFGKLGKGAALMRTATD